MKVAWSATFQFDEPSVIKLVPAEPGVYRILQSPPYPRYEGVTRILKIGKSDTNLRAELVNHVYRHTVANRLRRVLNRAGVTVEADFALIDHDPGSVEATLLREFEDEHWDLPLLNSQRGYKRGTDRNYR